MRAVLLLGASLFVPCAATAQLRPLEPLEWRIFEGDNHVVATVGAALLEGQRASLAGTEGRLLEAGVFAALVRFDRVVIEAAGTLYRSLEEELVFAEPVDGTLPPTGQGRTDLGDFRLSTIIRLTPPLSRAGVVLRFGTRLPTTDNRIGLERDQTDFFALLGASAPTGPLRWNAEAGVGVNGTRNGEYEQSDVAIYALTATYARGRIRPVAEFLGHFDGLKNGSARGAEDLKELRAGVRYASGQWWAHVMAVKGYERFSPRSGVLVGLGLAR